MKRKFTLFCVAAVLFGMFAGCSSVKEPDVTSEEIWQAISDRLDMDTMPQLVELDDTTLEAYYRLTADQADEYTGFFPLMNVSATEILIIKAKDGNTAAIKDGIMQHHADLVRTWSMYLPDQYALVEDYRLVENGSWILYAVAADVDEIVKAFNEKTKV